MFKENFKKIALFLLAFTLIMVPAYKVSAQVKTGNGGNVSAGNSGNVKAGNPERTGIENPIGSGSLDEFLKRLLDIFVVLGAIIVVFFIIYAGLQYVLARGDVKKIEQAHKTLTWTVIGAAILLGAQVISTVIQTTVTELAK